MTKYYLIFGGISGSIAAFLDYQIFSENIPFSNIGKVFGSKLIVLLFCIIFATILIKKISGRISFLRTTFGGLMIALICSSVNLAGYSYMASPDYSFFKNAIEYRAKIQKENDEKVSDKVPKIEGEEIDYLKEAKAAFNVNTVAKLLIFGYTIAGLLISVLLSAFISDPMSLDA